MSWATGRRASRMTVPSIFVLTILLLCSRHRGVPLVARCSIGLLAVPSVDASVVLLWQIHADPASGEAHALLFVHVHAGVVALEKRDVGALRAEVCEELLGLRGGFGRRDVGKVGAKALAQWRALFGEDWSGRKLTEERAVEGAQGLW